MFNRFKRSKKEKKVSLDFLSLTRKEKIRIIAFFCLKWGGIILLPEILIMVLLDLYTDFIGNYFFGYQLFLIPGALLILGGCMGGLSRYNIPPKMRIVEPDDQAVAPSEFQIRVRYDPEFVDPKTIRITVNEQIIPHKLDIGKSIAIVPKVFKTPPKRAISILLEAKAQDITGKDLTDKIRIICDPDSDEEDYLEYWEFKREDDTYWGKEMVAAARHSRRILNSMKLMVLAFVLLAANYIVTLIYQAILTAVTS